MYDKRPAYKLTRRLELARPDTDYMSGLRDALADVARSASTPPAYIRPKYKPDPLPATLAPVSEAKVMADTRGTKVSPTRLKQREAFNVHDNSRDVRTNDDRHTCKLRPENNKPRRGRGGGKPSRNFIPWCT